MTGTHWGWGWVVMPISGSGVIGTVTGAQHMMGGTMALIDSIGAVMSGGRA